MDRPATIPEFIQFLARQSEILASQAGVGGMETAGSAISYLAAYPEDIEPFLNGSFLELPPGWHERGCLTWHGTTGQIVSPEFARHARIVSSLKEQLRPTTGDPQ